MVSGESYHQVVNGFHSRGSCFPMSEVRKNNSGIISDRQIYERCD